ERAGRRVMDSIRKFIERRLRLVVNEEKSSVSRPNDLTFLGFHLGTTPDGKVTVTPSKRTEARLAARIRELTPRTWGQSVAACIEKVNGYLRGWFGYFRLCTAEGLISFGTFDAQHQQRFHRDKCLGPNRGILRRWSRERPWLTNRQVTHSRFRSR